MSYLELILIGVGLSMDAFAASICQGLRMKRLKLKGALTIAIAFGGFQGIMPLLGWLLGSRFEQYIVKIDHWIAFILLAIIGVKMIKEAFDEEEVCQDAHGTIDLKEIVLLAIATSIDALAVGITFAFLRVSIGTAAGLIAIITFIITFAGVYIGTICGTKYKQKAEIFGGFILIIIGIKILVEHLGLI